MQPVFMSEPSNPHGWNTCSKISLIKNDYLLSIRELICRGMIYFSTFICKDIFFDEKFKLSSFPTSSPSIRVSSEMSRIMGHIN